MHVSLDKACELLLSGEVVAIPTETVYGLAAHLHQPRAVANIFALKGRPVNNPLIIHLAVAADISKYVAQLPPDYEKLTTAFWPGPLTLVLPAILSTIPEEVRAGLPTAAFRVPSHPLTRQVLAKTGPLVMPSANLSGRPSATQAQHVETDLGKDFPILDGGGCQRGVESTILIWQEKSWVIIRLGALSPEAFMPILGYVPELMMSAKPGMQAPLCPGQLYRHYAPKALLTLTREFPKNLDGIVVGFEDRDYPKNCRVLSLGKSNDPDTASQRLYATLRKLDLDGIEHAYVDADIPEHGLWITLKERLSKASKK